MGSERGKTSEQGGSLKKRLKGVRRRKRLQESWRRDARGLRIRLVEVRGRVER